MKHFVNPRRKLLTALAVGTLANAWPAFAQQPGKVWRIGFLIPRARPVSIDADFLGGFPQGMRELGYVEGRNLLIEWRFAGGDPARLPGLAAELVQLKVDLILAVGAQAIGAAQKATSTIPIVMGIAGDPVSDGFVKTLGRPGGNITGTSLMMIEIMPKRLEILQELAPKLTRVAALFNPANSTSVASLASLTAAAQGLRIGIVPAEARTVQEIEPAFAAMMRDRAAALVVIPDSLLNSQAVLGGGNRRQAPPARGGGLARIRRSRRPGELRAKLLRDHAPHGHLYRQDLQGCQTGRPAGRAADQVRTLHQRQDRQGIGSEDSAVAVDQCGEGD